MDKNERLEAINKKMEDLKDKVKDSAETVAIIGLEAKDIVDDKIKDSKGNIEALKENYRLASERSKSKISSELIKAQMTMDVAKEKIQEYKDAVDQAKLAAYIDEEIEYADSCIALSLLAAEEAKLAYLEAVEAQKEYEEKYGTEE